MIFKETEPVTGDKVIVKTEYTVISGGTERACIMGMTVSTMDIATDAYRNMKETVDVKDVPTLSRYDEMMNCPSRAKRKTRTHTSTSL